MTIVFDLDGTLCVGRPYKDARPVPGAAELLSELKAKGHKIVIYTARGMKTYEGQVGKVVAKLSRLTLEQLDSWGFVYDEIVFGKPAGDIYVDDKGITAGSIRTIRDTITSIEQASKLSGSLDQMTREIESKLSNVSLGCGDGR